MPQKSRHCTARPAYSARGIGVKIRDVRPVLFSTEQRNCLVCVVETDDGVKGYGEAGMSSQLPAVAAAIETLKVRVVDQDATRIEHLWQLMFRGGVFPRGNGLSSAGAGVDIPLSDV